MSTARHRSMDSRKGTVGSYDYYYAPGPVYRTALQGEQKVMDDVVGNPLGANPLDLVTTYVYRPLLDGTQVGLGGGKLRSLDGYAIDYDPNPPDPSDYLPGFGAGDVVNWGWETVAKTNASQPHVSVPTFFGEAKDFGSVRGLPGFVRDFGSNILRNVAKGYISWRWAVKPLMGDIVKLCNFHDAVVKRRLDLQLLDKNKTSSRKASLSRTDYVGPVVNHFLSSSTGFVVRGDRQVFAKESVWGSVKWKLDPSVVLPDDDEERWKFARNLTFGITSYEALATAWELTPWSWFADWFYGIGDLIAASNNSVPLTWSSCCIMRHTEAFAKWTITQEPPDWALMSGVPIERTERKQRFVAPALPPFLPSYRPLVNWRAWSILGSLAATRIPRVPRGPRYRRRR